MCPEALKARSREAPADVIGHAICRCHVCLLVRLIGVAGKANPSGEHRPSRVGDGPTGAICLHEQI